MFSKHTIWKMLCSNWLMLGRHVSLTYQFYTMQVIERLTERRIAVEKAVTTIGEAPSGLRDVFELCRGFERAFTNLVNVSAWCMEAWQQHAAPNAAGIAGRLAGRHSRTIESASAVQGCHGLAGTLPRA